VGEILVEAQQVEVVGDLQVEEVSVLQVSLVAVVKVFLVEVILFHQVEVVEDPTAGPVEVRLISPDSKKQGHKDGRGIWREERGREDRCMVTQGHREGEDSYHPDRCCTQVEEEDRWCRCLQDRWWEETLTVGLYQDRNVGRNRCSSVSRSLRRPARMSPTKYA